MAPAEAEERRGRMGEDGECANRRRRRRDLDAGCWSWAGSLLSGAARRKSLVSAAIVGTRRGTIAIMRKLRESNAAPFPFPPPALSRSSSPPPPPLHRRFFTRASTCSRRRRLARARHWKLQETNRRVRARNAKERRVESADITAMPFTRGTPRKTSRN